MEGNRLDLPLTKDNFLLMSSLLDPTSRLLAEAKQKKAKKRKFVNVPVNLEIQSREEDNPMLHLLSGVAVHQKNVSHHPRGFRTGPEIRMALLQGQHLKVSEASKISISDFNLTPMVQVRWEDQIQWDTSPPTSEAVSEVAAPLISNVPTYAEIDNAMNFAEEEWEDAVVESSAQMEYSVPDVKRMRPQGWFLPRTENQKQSVDEFELKRLTDTSMIGRNVLLEHGNWEKFIRWDDKEEVLMTLFPVQYHRLDQTFALDEIQRKKSLLLEQEDQEKRIKSRQEALAAKAAAEAAAAQIALAPPPPVAAASEEVNLALVGKIQAPPPQKPNDPKRGPKKRELEERRDKQFGELIKAWGIKPSRVPPPPPPTATTTTTTTTESQELGASEPGYCGWTSVVPVIRHAEPALELEVFQPQMKSRHLEHFHRPVTHHPKEGVKITVFVDSSHWNAEGIRRPMPMAKDQWRRANLTNREGKLCLFEYAEQHPILCNAFGMNSNLINFSRDAPAKFSVGRNVMLRTDEFSPLMTQIEHGKQYRVLQNNMMIAPIVEHNVSSTDFLLIRQGEFSQVRRIAHSFVCGQVEPQMEIFQPNEPVRNSKFLTWLDTYMEFHFANKLRSRDELGISFQHALEMFPFASEKMVERALSVVAEKDKNTSVDSKRRMWIPIQSTSELTGRAKDSEELRRELEDTRIRYLAKLKPEDCVSWEQLQFGLFRLSQSGIEKVARIEVTRLQEAYQMLNNLFSLRKASHSALRAESKTKQGKGFPPEALRQLAAARYVFFEANVTPWYLSSCFYWLFLNTEKGNNPFPTDTVLKITRLGDPLGQGNMVSFLPSFSYVRAGEQHSKRVLEDESGEVDMYDVSEQKKKVKRKKTLAPQEEKRVISGSADDLRGVTMTDLGDILVELGIPRSEVDKIQRWDRTWLIFMAASSAQGATLLGGRIARYARHSQVPTSSHNTAADDAPIELTGDSYRDLLAARKKLEESTSFSEMRKSLTKVYTRMMAWLANPVPPQSAPAPTALTAQVEDEEEDPDVREMLETMEMDLLGESKQEDEILERIKRGGGLGASALAAPPVIAETEQDSGMLGGLEMYKAVPVLKRTIIEVLPNGSEHVRVEYHRSAVAVKQFKERQSQQAEAQAAAAIAALPSNKPRAPRKSASSSSAANNQKKVEERERAKTEAKEQRIKEQQAQNAAWYAEQVAKFGKDFSKSYVEDDARLPSTMPRRGRSKPNKVVSQPQTILRCSVCSIPGHGKQSPLCPLFEEKKESAAAAAALAAAAAPAPRKPFLPSTTLPGPLGELMNKFLRIHVDVMSNPASAAFRSISRRNPSYHTTRHTMDLSKIKEKVDTGKYKTCGQFVHDFQLMLSESNSSHSQKSVMSDNARLMIDQVKQMIDSDAKEFKRLENLVTNTKKKSGSTTTAAAAAAPVVSSPLENQMTAAATFPAFTGGHVVVEGDEEFIAEEDDNSIEEGEVA